MPDGVGEAVLAVNEVVKLADQLGQHLLPSQGVFDPDGGDRHVFLDGDDVALGPFGAPWL